MARVKQIIFRIRSDRNLHRSHDVGIVTCDESRVYQKARDCGIPAEEADEIVNWFHDAREGDAYRVLNRWERVTHIVLCRDPGPHWAAPIAPAQKKKHGRPRKKG